MGRGDGIRRVLLPLLGVLAAAVVAGCGGTGASTADLSNGKQLFAQRCGSCHVLERAAAGGRTGPNLDQAFGPARRDGMDSQTIAGVVEYQIAHPRRSSSMPANLVRGDDARDVAAYVGRVAGVPGEDRGALAQAGLAGARDGKQIFAAAGCGACHTFADAGTNSATGPNLDELAAAAGRREPGKSPEEYTEEAIVEPNAFVADGFQPGVMPDSYGEQLKPEQVDALVKYLLETGG